MRFGEEEEEVEGYGERVSSSVQVSSPAPSLQLSSTPDESLALLYLSHSDEVELMATFTPADVISVLRLGSRRVGYLLGYLLGASVCPPADTHECLHHLACFRPNVLRSALSNGSANVE